MLVVRHAEKAMHLEHPERCDNPNGSKWRNENPADRPHPRNDLRGDRQRGHGLILRQPLVQPKHNPLQMSSVAPRTLLSAIGGGPFLRAASVP
jgi:hypothetical protein